MGRYFVCNARDLSDGMYSLWKPKASKTAPAIMIQKPGSENIPSFRLQAKLRSFRLRLRLINASLAKLSRSFGELVSALGAFVGRGGCIGHLADGGFGQFFRTRGARGRQLFSLRLDGQS